MSSRILTLNSASWFFNLSREYLLKIFEQRCVIIKFFASEKYIVTGICKIFLKENEISLGKQCKRLFPKYW